MEKKNVKEKIDEKRGWVRSSNKVKVWGKKRVGDGDTEWEGET